MSSSCIVSRLMTTRWWSEPVSGVAAFGIWKVTVFPQSYIVQPIVYTGSVVWDQASARPQSLSFAKCALPPYAPRDAATMLAELASYVGLAGILVFQKLVGA